MFKYVIIRPSVSPYTCPKRKMVDSDFVWIIGLFEIDSFQSTVGAGVTASKQLLAE